MTRFIVHRDTKRAVELKKNSRCLELTIKIKKFSKLDNALSYLESLSVNNPQIMVFRGHQNSKWRLQTTLNRFKSVIMTRNNEPYDAQISGILEQFKGNLSRLGDLPFSNNSRIDWLEFAQHHGVPTPLLDFTYSPYVALFFAFNGIDIYYGAKRRMKKYVAIYALNINRLASAWIRRKIPFQPGTLDHEVSEAFGNFINPEGNLFENGYPVNDLKFVPRSGAQNYRMLRQMGVFIYDSLDYARLRVRDLEEFIEQLQKTIVDGSPNGESKEDDPVLTKVLISEECVNEVFSRLELMGITGTILFGDSNGAAMDVKNAYHYNPKTMLIRDKRIWDHGTQ